MSQMPVGAVVVAILLLAGLGCFVRFFIRPASKLNTTLARTISRLDAARARQDWNLASCFEGDATLEHIWREYQETLHEQRATNPSTGELEVIAVRSTIPAEVYFSGQAVVDTRVHAEFFKHFPGVLTGLGIIGTFGGLIQGVSSFQVSGADDVVQKSLQALLHGVGEAFYVSAAAISLAMAATVIEKGFLNRLYGRLERLNQILDSCFEGGVGEAYLSRLVAAAEESSSQARVLKDALVNDLKQLLSEVAERQIASSRQSNLELGEHIAASISSGLRGPLDEIAVAVQQVSQDQSGAVSKLLTDVLAGFGQRMEDLFGSQLAGISEMQQRTITAMETAISRLNEVGANLQAAGTSATEAMSERLAAAMVAAEARQRAMTDELAAAIGQLKSSAAETQSDAQKHMQEMLASLSEQVSAAVQSLQAEMAQRSAEQNERERKAAELAAGQVDRISGEVVRLAGGVGEAVSAVQLQASEMMEAMSEKMQASIAALQAQMAERADEQGVREARHAEEAANQISQMAGEVGKLSTGVSDVMTAVKSMVGKLDAVTDNLVKQLNGGAETLVLAASQFERAGGDVARSFSSISEVTGGLSSAAGVMTNASRSLDSAISDYKSARDSIAQMVTSLKETAHVATRDAAVTSQLVGRIEAAAQGLGSAHEEAERYLKDVTDVLTSAHQAFADGMRQTVGEANKAFHTELSQAASLLRDAIQELEFALPAGGRVAAE